MIRILFSFLFLISSVALSAIPHDGKFYKGADAVVAQSQLSGFYQPSQRFPLIQTIQNYRFLGNQGFWNPEIPVHVQSISGNANPQTYVDSLIQLLFPSPDGVNLTPNQAESDPLSRLSVDYLIALINFSKNSDTSEDDLRSALFPNIQISDEIRENYYEFLRYEFARQIKGNLDGTPESTIKSLGIDQANPNWRSEFVRDLYRELFSENGLRIGDIEKTAMGSRYAKLRGLKIPSKKQSIELGELEKGLGEDAQKYVLFEQNREVFLVYRFLDTFLKALKETDALVDQPIEKALLSYMWLKFKSSGERAEFYEKMGASDLKKIFEEKTYTFNDYLNLKHQLNECDTLSKKIERKKKTIAKFEDELQKLTQHKGKRRRVNSRKTYLSQILPELRQDLMDLEKQLDKSVNFIRQLSPEEMALLKYGYELYEMQSPDIVPYGHATVIVKDKSKTFPDCVETSILSLLLNRARIYKDGHYQIDAAQFPEISPLHGFFKEIRNPIDFYSPETHNRFAEILRNLKGVKYLKPGGSQNGTYEVKPGLINSLHVFGNLIPELVDLLSVNEKSPHSEFLQALDQLSHYLFAKEGSWQAPTIEDFSKEIANGDIYDDIIFLRREVPLYKWTHEEEHSSTSKLFETESVFDKDLVWFLVDPLRVGFVGLNNRSMYYDLKDLPQVHSQFLITSSYDSSHLRRLGIWQIFDFSKNERLKPLGLSLLRVSRELEDSGVEPEDPQDSVAEILYCLSKLVGSKLSMEEFREILTVGLGELHRFTWNSLSEVSDRLYLVNLCLDLEYKDLLLEKAKTTNNFAMMISTPQSLEFFDDVIGVLKNISWMAFYVSDLDILKAPFEKHQPKLSEFKERFRVDVKNLNVASTWFLDWVKCLKGRLIMQIDDLTFDAEDQLKDFFRELYKAHPKVIIYDDNLPQPYQDLIRGLQPQSSDKDEVEEENDNLQN